MGKPKIFKVSAEYFIRANDITEAEDYVKEEAGLEYYERHIIIDETSKEKHLHTIPIDVDLTK